MLKRPHSSGAWVSATIMLASVLGGCSNASTPDAASFSSGSDPAPFGALPTDAWLHPVYDNAAVERYDERSKAHQGFLYECLVSRGFNQMPMRDFGSYMFPTPIDRNADWSEQREYTAKHGFGHSDGTTFAFTSPEVGPHFTNDVDAAAYYMALDECAAKWTTPKDYDVPGENVDPIVIQVADSISADSDWASAEGRLWAPCMRTRGYNYAGIEVLWDDIDARLKAAETAPDPAAARTAAAAFEIDSAKASLECRITEVIAAERVVEIRLNLERGLIDAPPG